MRKSHFAIMTAVCLLSTGCSTAEAPSDAIQTTVRPETTSVSSAVTDVIAVDVADDFNKTSISEHGIVLVPDCEINTDVNMNIVNINGIDVDISDIMLDKLLSVTGTELNRFGTTYHDRDTHRFVGYTYGVSGEPDPAYEGMNVTIDGITYDGGDLSTFGTTFTVEVMQGDDVLVLDEGINSSEFDQYRVKGIEADLFYTENDFSIIFADNIQVGMSRDDCIAVLGDGRFVDFGSETAQMYIYNNGINTMVTIFEPDEFTGEYVLDSIELINN